MSKVAKLSKNAARGAGLGWGMADEAADRWSILSAFAQRTYAPATENSRLLGAGAGLGDDD